MQSVYSIAPANWATGHLLGESYPSGEMQYVYSTALVDWATGHSLGESYPSGEMQYVYSTAPANWATGHSLGESYPSGEMQYVYSTALADWAIIRLVCFICLRTQELLMVYLMSKLDSSINYQNLSYLYFQDIYVRICTECSKDLNF